MSCPSMIFIMSFLFCCLVRTGVVVVSAPIGVALERCVPVFM